MPRLCASLAATAARAAGGFAVCTLLSFAAPRLLVGQEVCPLSTDPGTSSGEITVQAACVYAVAVTPDGGTAGTTPTRVPGPSYTALFTVRNTGTGGSTDTYFFSCIGTLGVNCSSVSPPNKTLVNNAQTTVTVTYTVTGTSGTGRLTLSADGNQNDTGYFDVPLAPANAVAVTPDGAVTPQREHGQSFSETFTIANPGLNANTYTLSCVGSGGVTCGSLSATSVSLAGNTTGTPPSTTVTASYSVSNTGPFTVNGTLTLSAAGTGASDNGSFSVPIVRHGVAVTPAVSAVTRLAGGTVYTESFTVQNTGTVSDTYTLSCVATGVVTCGSASPASLSGLAAGASAAATVSYTVSASGSGSVALRAASSFTSHQAATTVTGATPTQQAPVVNNGDVNTGSTLERSLCLTVALGESAAAECGDLRIVHALPTTRTMNKARTPVLLYNSATAHPYPIVAANVRLPADALIPTSVEGRLRIGTLAQVVKSWSGSEWTPGAVRRIAIATDATSLATGLYSYTLEVRNWYGSTSKLTTVTGVVPIVNRSGSPFGAGWWLAGLEQLAINGTQPIMWISGDGSVRKYTRIGTTNNWSSFDVDHPDTLKLSGTNYTRYDVDSVWVKFNGSGQHIETKNRQKHTTTFAHTSGRLSSITLPVPAGGPTKTYTFAYDANSKLATVTAPGPGTPATRVTTVVISSGRVNSIRDPDNSLVQFGHDAGWTNRISTRTDRRGTVTTFSIDAGKKISQASLNMGAGQPAIVTGLLAVESRGFSGSGTPSSVDSTVAYSRLDGPRTDVADTAVFWLDRFGAPVKIVDAIGGTTLITRGGGTPSWPGLVTRVQYPKANPASTPQVLGATYDNRGRLLTVTDSSTFNGGATTTYQWDTKWDEVSRITQPEGDFVAFSYDGGSGNRLWQEDGRGSTTRVTFGYNSDRQPTSITRLGPPATSTERITYDAAGNVDTTITGKGYRTTYRTDGVGRVTKVTSPIDTGATPTLFQTQETLYDLADRDTLVNSAGSAMSGVAVESLFVRKHYNLNGQDTLVSRWTVPNSASISTVTNRWRYDLAGRVIVEVDPANAEDRIDYDPAGNPVRRITRRGHTITMTYDALHRLVRRALPDASYPARPTSVTHVDYPPVQADIRAYSIPAEADTFSYDGRGRLLTADNANAKVKRTYYPNGLVMTDSLWIATGDRSSFTAHRYGSFYFYDRNGRRTMLSVPAQLAGATSPNISYTYVPLLGALESVTDLGGNTYTFAYTARGELASVNYPQQYQHRLGYDPDGRLIGDTVENLGSVSYPRIGQRWVRTMRLAYDARKRLVKRTDANSFSDDFTLSYTGLGNLKTTRLTQSGYNFFGNTVNHVLDETYAHDPLGNRTSTLASWTLTDLATGSQESDGRSQTATYQPGLGRLATTVEGGGTMTFSYDAAGNVDVSARTATPPEQRAAYYAADGTLRAVEWRWLRNGSNVETDWKIGFEEYRYDALGRRVWTRADKDCQRNLSSWSSLQILECETDVVRRTVWDGAQELAEIQMPPLTHAENDTAKVELGLASRGGTPGYADPNPWFGRVVYVHGAALDRPLAVTRYNYVYRMDQQSFATFPPITIPRLIVMPFVAQHTEATLGAFTTRGEWKYCEPPASDQKCVGVPWTRYRSAYDRMQGAIWDNWWGTLLEQKRDKSGLEYKRNRYYDPQTGRFTQEDPIGLAGGVNLYGFANGDPVNFADPFGLCPPENNSLADCPADQKFIHLMARNARGVDAFVRSYSALAAAPLVIVGGAELAGGAGIATLNIARAAPLGAGATRLAEPSRKMIAAFQRQLEEHGAGSLRASARSISERLTTHLEKLETYRAEGGFTSSVEREIRTFERQLEAIRRVLEGNK